MEIEEYALSFDVGFHSLSIRGRERLRVLNPEKDLFLDSFGLVIKHVQIAGRDIPFEDDPPSKKLKISNLPQKSSIEIDIDYDGKVTEKTLYGVYKSNYGSDYFVTTDFEPNGARLLFPCVDNPSIKAEFSLDVTTEKGLTVISNARTKTIVDLGDKVKYEFQKTPKMSTYLFYMGIGKFDQSTLRDRNVEFRLFARPDHASKGKYALENAAKFLRAYEEYYGIAYPLGKLDLIGLPEYASGAMENWGAITFREIVLLIDENSSVSNKRGVTSVLGHEIAHMWFGDLVTMHWWNDLWLNESFATFMESKMTNKLYPEWNVISDFVQQTTAGSMQSDSLSSTHPIDVKVTAPEEISQIFDEISYGKGASVLRMIEAWIGEEAFRKGVSDYLSEFKYANAEGSDLWRHLEKASGQPVSEIMQAWVKKPGFPVVTLSLDQGKLVFSQERFILSAQNTLSEIWPIPIICLINDEERKFVLKDRIFELPIGQVKRLKANLGQTGFYRVLYDQRLYSVIEKEFDDLRPFDRWGIVADLFAFLLAGKVTTKQYVTLVKRCVHDTDYLVADAVTTQLQFLRFISPENPLIGEVYLNHHESQLKRLGLDSKNGEKDTDKLLRGRLATGLALTSKTFAVELSKRFTEYERVDPNLRVAVAVSFAQTTGRTGFDQLVDTMKKMGSEADVVKIYFGLTSFRDPKLIEKTLDLCISGEISRADSLYALIDATQNPYVREATWNWVKNNFHVFRELFQGTPYVSQILQEVISRTGLGREEEVEEYFARVKIAEADKGIRKGFELLGIYSNLKKRLDS
ncbi:MAG: M1 family metallopeptidase [Nitrososphaerales archaeon]